MRLYCIDKGGYAAYPGKYRLKPIYRTGQKYLQSLSPRLYTDIVPEYARVFVFHIKPEPVKPDKTPLPYQDFKALDEHLRQVLGQSRYQSHPGIVLDDQSTMWIFTRKHKLSELDLFTVIRTSELQKDFMDDVANDAVTEFLQGYYQKGQITDSINMIALVCVDRVSPAFYEFINTPLEQGMKNGRFLAGATFGGKILYIGRQEDGFAIAKYKRLRREFLRVVGVPEK